MRYLLTILTIVILAMGSLAQSKKGGRSTNTVKKEQSELNKRINKTQQDIEINKKSTLNQLKTLNSLNSIIDHTGDNINKINARIEALNKEEIALSDSIAQIEKDVETLKKECAKNLVDSRKRRRSMSELSLIFSSTSFYQALKRTGYIKQINKLAASKTTQLKNKETELLDKKAALAKLREEQTRLAVSLDSERRVLIEKQAQTSQLIDNLRKEGQTLAVALKEQQEKARQLDRELERIIAEEARLAEEARKAEEARLAAERARKAEEERLAAERAKKAEEARLAEERARKAEEAQKAEEARKQEAARDAEAQKAEQAKKEKEAKEQAKKDKNKKKKEKKQKGKKTVNAPTETATPTPTEGASPAKTETPAPTKTETKTSNAIESTADLTRSFASNKGLLLFPVSGNYNIVSTFGRNRHKDLEFIEVENSGIDIEAASGTNARAVFDGVVSSIFFMDGFHNIVMVRHGEYLTVYANIDRLNVKKGDKVKSGQNLGHIFSDPNDNNRTTLHFEVRKETQKLNPLEWVKR